MDINFNFSEPNCIFGHNHVYDCSFLLSSLMHRLLTLMLQRSTWPSSFWISIWLADVSFFLCLKITSDLSTPAIHLTHLHSCLPWILPFSLSPCPHSMPPHLQPLQKSFTSPLSVQSTNNQHFFKTALSSLTNMVTVGEGPWNRDVAELSCLLSSYKLLFWSTSPDQEAPCDLPPTLARLFQITSFR